MAALGATDRTRQFRSRPSRNFRMALRGGQQPDGHRAVAEKTWSVALDAELPFDFSSSRAALQRFLSVELTRRAAAARHLSDLRKSG